MSCSELHGAQQKMHDEIASALVLGTAEVLSRQGQVQPRVEKHLAPRVDSLWPDCPPELRDFVPDGIILTYAYPTSREPSRVLIIEFARSYTIKHDEMVTAGAAKHNQYHHLERFLRNQYPGHEVHCQSYIISVLGVYPQAAWLANCHTLRFTPAQATQLQIAGVRACVMAGHALNNTARSRLEALRTGGVDAGPGIPRTGIG
eukprot:781842-Rhodomonas_salina.3